MKEISEEGGDELEVLEDKRPGEDEGVSTIDAGADVPVYVRSIEVLLWIKD